MENESDRTQLEENVSVPAGAALISAERQRQIDVEGFGSERDDSYKNGQLIMAAICFAAYQQVFIKRDFVVKETGAPAYAFEDPWPEDWDSAWDKRTRSINGRSPYPCNPFYCGRKEA